jgi:hypothetical protein
MLHEPERRIDLDEMFMEISRFTIDNYGSCGGPLNCTVDISGNVCYWQGIVLSPTVVQSIRS